MSFTYPKGYNETVRILDAASIDYTITYFFSGFHGKRITFPDLKTAKKAEKAVGNTATRNFKKWCMEFYS